MPLKAILNNYAKTILWIYLTIMLLLDILPLNNSNSALNNNYSLDLRWDYIIHALVYIPLPFLLLNTKIKLWLGIALAIVLASGFEFLQMGLSYRTFNINDLIANATGVIFGIFIALLLIKSQQFKTLKSLYMITLVRRLKNYLV